jgi:hypothetical protein
MSDGRLAAVISILLVETIPAFSAGCGDITLCAKNPPFPPAPPSCITYQNFCSDMAPDIANQFQSLTRQAQPQADQGNASPPKNFSITIDGLSEDTMSKVLDQLGIDKDKVRPSQK